MTGSNKQPIGLALIGAGGIGKRWGNIIRDVKQVRLVAVVDVDRKKAAHIAGAYPSCGIFSDARDVEKRDDIDAVIVATPHVFLSSITVAMLRAGKHVLSEKPGAVCARDMKKALLVATRKNLRYMVGFNHRFHEGFLHAHALFQKGVIGDIQFIRSVYGFGGRPGMEKEWRLKKSVSGGGELLDQGVHMIDMARMFLGDFKDVRGFADPLFWKADVEDNAFVLLRTKKKQTVSIHVSWSNWKPTHRFEIYGTKGYIVVDGLGKKYGGTEKVILGTRSAESGVEKEEEIICDPNADLSLERELKEFTSAIMEKRAPVPGGVDALQTLQIVERIYSKNV